MPVTGKAAAEEDRMLSSRQSGAQAAAAVRKPSPYDLYHPWREPVRLFAGVTPCGFRIEEHVYPELRGRVIATRFVRKLFLDQALLCYAADAVCARRGSSCDECGETRCRAYLRIELAYDSAIYTIDLGVSSAVNFVRLQESALASGQLIVDVPLKLTVAHRGDGGEVNFTPV
jgi:hypothetical protein